MFLVCQVECWTTSDDDKLSWITQNFLSCHGEKWTMRMFIFLPYIPWYEWKRSVWKHVRESKEQRQKEEVKESFPLCVCLNITNEDIIPLELKLRVCSMSVRIRAWCEWITENFYDVNAFWFVRRWSEKNTKEISPSWIWKL